MRSDANRLGLRTIRAILDGAHSFDLEVAGTKVSCTVERAPIAPWPASGLDGLDAGIDGEWPRGVIVTCTWEGGQCAMVVACHYWQTKTRYRHQVGLAVRLKGRARELLWITVPPALGKTEDGEKALLATSVSAKQRQNGDAQHNARINEMLRPLLAGSKLPLIKAASVAVCEVEVPACTILPSPEIAFGRLVHVALLKLEFLDRGPEARDRGRPLVDLGEWASTLRGTVLDDETEEEDDDESEPRERRYWAGGIPLGSASKLKEFTSQAFWQVDRQLSGGDKAAQATWDRFSEIRRGDYFAIKGYEGEHDLTIHLVGEVTATAPEIGRIELRRLNVPLYRGEAPRGRGAGSWFDALVPVTRKDTIEQIFGVTARSAVPSEGLVPSDIARNLILYGPPGTGKTYHLQTEYMRYFVRSTAQSEAAHDLTDLATTLKWYQTIAVAMHDLGGQAKVDDLLAHPLLKAKYVLQNIPTPLRQMVWNTLGQHTVESSTTVKIKRRLGDLLFDKKEDGTWFLAEALPEDLAEASQGLKAPQATSEQQNFTFITFHQAYAYEDFIEGIRPQLATDADDETSDLRYALEDGVFKRAVRAALRVAGYEGTLDDFCKLSPDERKQRMDGARPYAIFIDEINRGNVARIFGELITLLEPDKRLGEDQEVIVTLPYSRTLFGVPSNLYVIGTMNTADRSVEALDAALRRRFAFRELPSKPELLTFAIEGDIDPAQLLRTINRRIQKLRDRDHCIGHAYFMDLKDEPTLEGLKRVFKQSVVPLLQEYFFGDWGKIGLVLGRDFVRRRDTSAIEFADFDHDERDALAERPTWELVDVDQLTSLAFRRIYGDAPENA